MITYLESIYVPMTENQVKKYIYIGMDLNFICNGMVKISMTRYTNKAVYELPEDVTTSVVIPAVEHLFNINQNRKQLNQEQAILFHWIIENLLFVGIFMRPDIQPTITLLVKRVQDTDEDDCKKLRCLLHHI